jgi:hypothetical protein
MVARFVFIYAFIAQVLGDRIHPRTITRRSQGPAPGLSLSIILNLLSMCGTKISQGMTPVHIYYLFGITIIQHN